MLQKKVQKKIWFSDKNLWNTAQQYKGVYSKTEVIDKIINPFDASLQITARFRRGISPQQYAQEMDFIRYIGNSKQHGSCNESVS